MFEVFHKLIDVQLRRMVRPASMRKMTVTQKQYPAFRYPDFYRAITAFVEKRQSLGEIQSSHMHLDLGSIVGSDFHSIATRKVSAPSIKLMNVDYQKEDAFPDECFWAFRDPNGVTGIWRLRTAPHLGTMVELAVDRMGNEAKFISELGDLSIEHSVYRNKLVQVDYRPAIEDEYGEVHVASELAITFRADPEITPDKIVLDPEVEPVLERNVTRFHRMRERLSVLGVPLQRGILLYGPPGTGKTYTCQHLYHRLKPITMIVVSGKGLNEVRSICNFARMLQPTVILLEDVDLMFASREINLYSSSLGEMMDELDGFQRDEAVMFILTTNAIDRLEKAIKDRPGRVSQCIYLGPPTSDLRKRYLARFVERYDTSRLSLDDVSKLCDGASQAFLKELVHRAVQIAAETQPSPIDNVSLELSHFDEAVSEMKRYASETGGIVGFG